MRVRTLELRLIGLVLAGCWVVAAAEVLIGYRPGGPVDVAVGRGRARAGRRRARGRRSGRPSPAATAAFAAMVWLAAGSLLLLVPSIADVAEPARRPRRPDAAAVGRGGLPVGARAASGRACSPASGSPGAGSARPRCAGAGVCPRRAHRDAPRGRRAGWSSPRSRWPTSSPCATGSRRRRGSARRTSTTTRRRCDGAMGIGTTARLELHLDGDARRPADRRRSTSSGERSVADVRWLAYVATNHDLGLHGAATDRRPRRGSASRSPAGAGRRPTRSPTTRSTSRRSSSPCRRRPARPPSRAASSIIEGARARQCRVAIDGPTFLAAFPPGRLARRRRRPRPLARPARLLGLPGRPDRPDRGQRQRRRGGHRAGRAPGDDPGRPVGDGSRLAVTLTPPAP